MIHPPDERLEAFAAGTADVTSRAMTEAHLAFCSTCAAAVGAYRARRPELGLPEASEAGPGEAAFERLWSRAQDLRGRELPPDLGVVPPAALAELGTIPAVRWRWDLWPEKTRYALLVKDPASGARLYLAHYPRDSEFPTHAHVGLEENVILAGGYQNGDVHNDAGDWVMGVPGTAHAPRTLPDEECWCLSRVEADGVKLLGWRGLFQPFVPD